MNEPNSLFGFHYWIWAGASAIIAIIYYFLWPRPVNNINTRPPWRHIVLRYFHSLVWVLIMISFLMRLTMPDAQGLADVVALLAFGVYLVFLVTSVIDKRAPN